MRVTWVGLRHRLGRGGDAGYPAPPAQIPACGTTAPGSCLGSTCRHPQGACRTRLSACDRRPRRCVRLLVYSATFPLASSLPSTCSAGPMGRPLFEGFLGTMKRSDSLHPSITVVPLGYTVLGSGARSSGQMQGLPGSAHRVSTHARGLRPRRVRLRLARTASTVWPSACSERVGTREKRRFRGSISCLHVPLSTLRRHRYRCLRMTRGQCGWLDLHCLGLAPFNILPAFPGTDLNAGPEPAAWKRERKRTLEAVRCSALFGAAGRGVSGPRPATCPEHSGEANASSGLFSGD